MKKVMIILLVIFTTCIGAQAMSYEQARREALFLTDKMAYELNLTDEQYNAAYEINLDYLMGVTGRDNVFGTYWERRNLDFSYILLDWQYRAFCAANYFYRPLYWDAGYWHFGIYACYPRTHFYFARPTVYISYRGGHSWHRNGGRSFWRTQRPTFNHSGVHRGMRDNQKRIIGHHDGRFDRNPGSNRPGNNNHGSNRPGSNNHDGNRLGNNNHDGNRPGNNNHDGNRPGNNNHDGNRHGMGNHNSSTRITVNGNDRRHDDVKTPANGSSNRFGGVRGSDGSGRNTPVFGGSRSSSVNNRASGVKSSGNISRSSGGGNISRSSGSGNISRSSGGGNISRNSGGGNISRSSGGGNISRSSSGGGNRNSGGNGGGFGNGRR